MPVLESSQSAHDLRLIANTIRHDIIRMLEASQSGHPGGSLSVTDILTTIYFSGVMEYDHTNPQSADRDYCILSKGHAAPALYAVFHQLGWIDDADILTLRQLGSKLQGHPDCHACPGVDVCSGSLGQGLSVACGVALGLRLDAQRENNTVAHRVFCVTGDGEMQEGSNWEAIMYAAQQKLDNLVLYVDRNGLQIDGQTEDICALSDVAQKLCAFGWDVQEIDGHDIDAILQATLTACKTPHQPHAIVCKTTKGKGVSFMENQVGWHGKAPNAEQAQQALDELDRARQILEQKEA